MPTQAPKPQLQQGKEARQFIETLEKTGQLVDELCGILGDETIRRRGLPALR
jgi:hypothetical protein